MHAVVITVKIAEGRRDDAVEELKANIIPMVKAAPGFVSGTWLGTEDGTFGHSIALFDTKEQAEAMSQGVTPPPGSAVTIAYNQVYEVVAQA